MLEYNFQDLYFSRPSLEYAEAFNQGCNILGECERVLVVSSSVFYATEIIKRIASPADFFSNGVFQADAFIQEAEAWSWEEIKSTDNIGRNEKYQGVIWAEPESHNFESLVKEISTRTEKDAVINIIFSGLLRFYLPEWKQKQLIRLTPANPFKVKTALKDMGWKIENQTSFHGPTSILLGYISKFYERLSRQDLADRWKVTMRNFYREANWSWPLMPVSLITARKK